PSTKTGASDSTILSKLAIKFVKAADKETERPTTDKGEPKELEQSEVSTARYKLWVKMGRSSPKNNYTHSSMPPRPAIHRPYRPPIRTTRPYSNAATRPYVNSARPQTTQELMIILIQRVQRLKRELKVRTPVHKVDRGRSSPVMAWVPKKEAIGLWIEVEPLDETPLEDLGLNTCNHATPLRSRENPIFDEPEPQRQPIPSFPSLEVNLGEERDLEQPIKSSSPDSFRMKEVDHLTIHTPPSPYVASFHPKDTSSSKLTRDQTFDPASSTNTTPKGRIRRSSKQKVENSNFEEHLPPVATMADNRTMAEMLRAPTEGCAEEIIVPPILAEQFELKHSLINMMTSKQFFGLEKDNPDDHIRWGSPPVARKRTPATTNLRNEISKFHQKFDESFHEAWERYKDQLRACPQHGFTELHQLDTFYNALNPADQDSLNAAAGGNLLEKVLKMR
nr:hypothetical protein [Tanacetum cinerariifolium]